MHDLAIINGSVWLDGTFVRTDIFISDGRIAAIGDHNGEARETYNVRGALVLPGLIDPHVHFDLDLGTLRSADDFASGSVAAAYGGVSTFVDFLDPTDHPDALEKAYYARRKQAKTSIVDYRFHATIKNPRCDLESYVRKMISLGMTTLKLFTTYADSGRRTYDDQIEALLALSERYHFTILAHIEDDAQIVMKDAFTFRDLPQSRPAAGETVEALKLAAMVERCGGTLYMVHLSSGTTLDQLRTQYPHLLNRRFFIESCPQYFMLTDAMLKRDDG
ncbi:MAG: amidohydrolase family protein, partial [bacterium]